MARATRTFPSATTVVAKSTTTGSAPVGMPSDQGLVPRKRAAPPKGVAPPIPGPAAPHGDLGHVSPSGRPLGVVAQAPDVVDAPDGHHRRALGAGQVDGLVEGPGGGELPEAVAGVHQQGGPPPGSHRRAAVRADRALLDHRGVLRDADHAVAVVSGQVGPHQVRRHLGGDLFRGPQGDEDPPPQSFQGLRLDGAVFSHQASPKSEVPSEVPSRMRGDDTSRARRQRSRCRRCVARRAPAQG